MQPLTGLLSTLPWFAWIAIVAIVCGAVQSVVHTLIKHRERMAMISQGMYPDPTEVEETEGACHTPQKSRIREL